MKPTALGAVALAAGCTRPVPPVAPQNHATAHVMAAPVARRPPPAPPLASASPQPSPPTDDDGLQDYAFQG